MKPGMDIVLAVIYHGNNFSGRFLISLKMASLLSDGLHIFDFCETIAPVLQDEYTHFLYQVCVFNAILFADCSQVSDICPFWALILPST